MVAKRKLVLGKSAKLTTEKDISCWVVYHQTDDFIRSDDYRNHNFRISYGDNPEGEKIDLQNFEQVAQALIGKNNKFGIDEHDLWRLTNNVMESWSKDFPKKYGDFIKTVFTFKSFMDEPNGMGLRSSMVGDMFWNVSEDKWYMVMGLGFREVMPCNKLKQSEINGLLHMYMGKKIQEEFDSYGTI